MGWTLALGAIVIGARAVDPALGAGVGGPAPFNQHFPGGPKMAATIPAPTRSLVAELLCRPTDGAGLPGRAVFIHSLSPHFLPSRHTAALDFALRLQEPGSMPSVALAKFHKSSASRLRITYDRWPRRPGRMYPSGRGASPCMSKVIKIGAKGGIPGPDSLTGCNETIL